MTSSFNPDQQRYIDTTGDGQIDTLVLSSDTPPEGDTDSVGTDGESTGISQTVNDEQLEAAVDYIIGFDQIQSPEKKEQIKQIMEDYKDNPIIKNALNTPLDSLPPTNEDVIQLTAAERAQEMARQRIAEGRNTVTRSRNSKY